MKIAVDLDGTLAEYHGWQGPNHIGAPISLMVSRVKNWVESGFTVVIFTARIDDDRPETVKYIQDWCEAQGLPRLQVTNVKQRDFHAFYDDRCVQVEPNTGRIVTESAKLLADRLQQLLS